MRRNALAALAAMFMLSFLAGCTAAAPAGDSGASAAPPGTRSMTPLSAYLSQVKVTTSDPNSAGGVDVEIALRNAGKVAIKYVIIDVEPYNAVDDMVSSEIGGKTTGKIRITGPIEPQGDVEASADNVWYNATIVRAKVVHISIDLMDGASAEIDGDGLSTASDGSVTDI